MVTKTHGLGVRITTWAAILVLPTIGVVRYQAWLEQRPALSVIFLLLYSIVIGLISIARKVYSELQRRWIERTTNFVDSKLRLIFSSFSAHYLNYVSEIHRDVDMKGLTTQGSYALSLEEVFVDLTLVPGAPHKMSGAVVEADESSRPRETLRQTVWDLLSRRSDNSTPLAVVGAPGGGKTTLLKHMTVKLARGYAPAALTGKRGRLLPVLLFLREHARQITNDPSVSISQLMVKSLAGMGIEPPPGWLEKHLQRGRCIVMLDGLDEVGSERDRRAVVDWTQHQIARFPTSYFVVTSRPYGYISYPLAGATIAQVRPLTEMQIQSFISGWYLATEARSSGRIDAGVKQRAASGALDLLTRLRKSAPLFALASNPLLLTMIAHVHHYRGALPGTRVELYREICQVFLGRRQEAKGIQDELSADQRELVLRKLAFEMMKRRVRDISLDDAVEIIRPELNRLRQRVRPHDFLLSVQQTCGLVMEREHNTYCFAHLTFQEYLTAVHIANKSLTNMLLREVADEWWHEVVLLYVAQRDGDSIVESCLAVRSRSATALALAAACADEARELAPELRTELRNTLSLRRCIEDQHRLSVAFAAILARKARRVIRVGKDAWACTELVTNEEFGFSRARQGKGFDDEAVALGDLRGVLPAVGITIEDGQQFVASAASHGVFFRFPTKMEVRAANEQASISGLESYPVWVHENGIFLLDRSQLTGQGAAQSAIAAIEQLRDDAFEVIRRIEYVQHGSDALLQEISHIVGSTVHPYDDLAIGVTLQKGTTVHFNHGLADNIYVSIYSKHGDVYQGTYTRGYRSGSGSNLAFTTKRPPGVSVYQPLFPFISAASATKEAHVLANLRALSQENERDLTLRLLVALCDEAYGFENEYQPTGNSVDPYSKPVSRAELQAFARTALARVAFDAAAQQKERGSRNSEHYSKRLLLALADLVVLEQERSYGTRADQALLLVRV